MNCLCITLYSHHSLRARARPASIVTPRDVEAKASQTGRSEVTGSSAYADDDDREYGNRAKLFSAHGSIAPDVAASDIRATVWRRGEPVARMAPAQSGCGSPGQISRRTMSFNPPIVFWTRLFLVLVSAVALLREVLLPFVAGMVLAYLLNPIAQRMERWGMNRLIATLVIIALALAIISALIILMVPVIVRELSYFIESFPLYVRQLRPLASAPARPWLGT